MLFEGKKELLARNFVTWQMAGKKESASRGKAPSVIFQCTKLGERFSCYPKRQRQFVGSCIPSACVMQHKVGAAYPWIIAHLHSWSTCCHTHKIIINTILVQERTIYRSGLLHRLSDALEFFQALYLCLTSNLGHEIHQSQYFFNRIKISKCNWADTHDQTSTGKSKQKTHLPFIAGYICPGSPSFDLSTNKTWKQSKHPPLSLEGLTSGMH